MGSRVTTQQSRGKVTSTGPDSPGFRQWQACALRGGGSAGGGVPVYPQASGRASRRRQQLGIPSRKCSGRGSSGHKAQEILPGGPRPTGFGWNAGVEAPGGQRALPPSNQGRTHPAQRPSTPVLSSLSPFLPSVMILIPGRRPAAWSAGREGDWCRPASAQLMGPNYEGAAAAPSPGSLSTLESLGAPPTPHPTASLPVRQNSTSGVHEGVIPADRGCNRR